MSSILSVVCLTSLIAAAGNASGISGAWRETVQAGMAQQYAGHFAQAEALLRDALEESRPSMVRILKPRRHSIIWGMCT